MARKGITYDQVANAARAIKARGAEPTIHAIRVEIGGEGSFTTISTHLAKWRAEEMDRVDTRSVPQEVEDALLSTLHQLWGVATKAADKDIAAIKQEAEDERRRLSERIKEAEEEITKLERAISDAEGAAEKATARAAEAEKKLAATSGELETAKRLYSELLATLKPQAAKAPKATDTKKAHPQATAGAPENKPGETH